MPLCPSCSQPVPDESRFCGSCGAPTGDNAADAIEAKATAKITRDHLKGLWQLARDHAVGRRIVVGLEARARKTEDGIEIRPAAEFARRLGQGELL